MLEIIESYTINDQDFEVWQCSIDGWKTLTFAGADVCCCPDCLARSEGG